MKRFLFLLVLMMSCLPLRVHAALLGDDCTITTERVWYEYRNLMRPVPGYEINWPTMPDTSFLMMTSNAAPASALYAVNGATSVSVSFYAQFSTIASLAGDRYQLGYVGTPDLTKLHRIKLSQNQLFLETEPLVWNTLKAYLLQGYFFTEPCAAPPEGAVDYGVSVLYSADSKNFKLAQTTLSLIRSSNEEGGISTWFYETYQCSLPEEAKYIRVELNEMALIPLPEGGMFTRQIGTMRLASVIFSGPEVMPGVLYFPSPPDHSDSSYDPDIQTSAVDPDASSSDNDSSDDSETSTESSSKSSSSKSSSSKSSSSKASSSKSSRSSKEPSEEEEEEPSSRVVPSIAPISRPPSAPPSTPAAPPLMVDPAPPAAPAPDQVAEDDEPPARKLDKEEVKTTAVGGTYIALALGSLAVIARRK